MSWWGGRRVRGRGVRGLFASRQSRLAAILVVATAAVSVLVVAAAGSSLSYYVTPEEYLQQASGDGTRWRVAGRVVRESIVEENGSPVAFSIRGYEGAIVDVAYRGGYPSLFGPNALVIVEGFEGAGGLIEAQSVIIKHENEFVTDADDTPAYVPPAQ